MQLILILLQLLVGIVQFFAIQDGLTHWLSLSPAVSITMALFFAFLPMVGSALGMAGALSVWGWTWWQGGLLFLAGFAIGLAIMTIIALTELFNDERREWLAGPTAGEAALRTVGNAGVARARAHRPAEAAHWRGSTVESPREAAGPRRSVPVGS